MLGGKVVEVPVKWWLFSKCALSIVSQYFYYIKYLIFLLYEGIELLLQSTSPFLHAWLERNPHFIIVDKNQKEWKRNMGPNVLSYMGKKLIERRDFWKTKGLRLNLWFKSFFHDYIDSQCLAKPDNLLENKRLLRKTVLEVDMIPSYALNRGPFFRSCPRNFCKHIGLHWKQKNLTGLLVLVPSQYSQKCKTSAGS